MSTQKNQTKTTSARKASDGISNLFNILSSNLGNETSKGNASTIYNIAKALL